MKLDFTNVTRDAPLTSVFDDITISGLEQIAKIWDISSLSLQIMPNPANLRIL